MIVLCASSREVLIVSSWFDRKNAVTVGLKIVLHDRQHNLYKSDQKKELQSFQNYNLSYSDVPSFLVNYMQTKPGIC